MKKCNLEFNSSPPCFQLIRKDQKESKKDPEFHFKFSLPGRSGRRPLRPETETVGVEVRSLFSANWFLTCDSDSYDAEHGRYGWRQGSLRPQILRITLFCSAGDKSSLLCFDLRIYLLTFWNFESHLYNEPKVLHLILFGPIHLLKGGTV